MAAPKDAAPPQLDKDRTRLTEFHVHLSQSKTSRGGFLERLLNPTSSSPSGMVSSMNDSGGSLHVSDVHSSSGTTGGGGGVSPPLSPAASSSSSSRRGSRAPSVAESESSGHQAQPQQPSAMSISFLLTSRQHWMSDKNCKVCYSCEQAFTTFRRRHHCRLCGRIFCNRCSSKRVSGKQYGHSGQLRVCQDCYDLFQVEVKKPKQQAALARAAKPHPPTVGKGGAAAGPESRARGSVKRRTDSGGAPPTKGRGRVDTVGDEAGDDVDSAEDSATSAHSRKRSKTRARRRRKTRAERSSRSTAGASIADDAQRDGNGGDGDANNGDDEDALSDEEDDDVDFGDEDDEEEEDDDLMLFKYHHDFTHARASHMIQSQFDTELVESEQAPLAPADLQLDTLGRVAEAYHRFVIERLIHAQRLDPAVWRDVILPFAQRACASLRPNVRHGDSIDFSRYFKINTIPGGDVSECTYIDGVSFCKNVTHRRMRTRIANPRILVLRGGIQFQRRSNQLASLDTLVTQESEYLHILAAKIAALQPDILVTEKGVARVAQDLLRQSGITIIMHVDSSTMARLARATGAYILPSPDYADKVMLPRKQLLGTCSLFHMRKYREPVASVMTPQSSPVPPRPKSIVSKSDLVLPDVDLSKVDPDDHSKWQTRVFMFFEGCSPLMHCGINLRGAPIATLTRVRNVLRAALFVGHNLRLETATLRNECATYPEPLVERFLEAMQRVPSDEEVLGATSERRQSSGTSTPSYVISPDEVADMYARYDAVAPLELSMREQLLQLSSSPFIRVLPRKVKVLLEPGSRRRASSMADLFAGSQDSSRTRVAPLAPTASSLDLPLVREDIMYSLCWVTESWQCFPPETCGLEFFHPEHDRTLGQFLTKQCFSLHTKCMNRKCKKNVLKHVLAFSHLGGRLTVAVNKTNRIFAPSRDPTQSGIVMMSWCKICRVPHAPVYMTEETYNMSFGKFLDLVFHNHSAVCTAADCGHSMHADHTRVFAFNNVTATFDYTEVPPFLPLIERDISVNERALQEMRQREVHDLVILSLQVFQEFVFKIAEVDSVLDETRSVRHQLQRLQQKITEEKSKYAELLADIETQTSLSVYQIHHLKLRLFNSFSEWNHTLMTLWRAEEASRRYHIERGTSAADGEPQIQPPIQSRAQSASVSVSAASSPATMSKLRSASVATGARDSPKPYRPFITVDTVRGGGADEDDFVPRHRLMSLSQPSSPVSYSVSKSEAQAARDAEPLPRSTPSSPREQPKSAVQERKESIIAIDLMNIENGGDIFSVDPELLRAISSSAKKKKKTTTTKESGGKPTAPLTRQNASRSVAAPSQPHSTVSMGEAPRVSLDELVARHPDRLTDDMVDFLREDGHCCMQLPTLIGDRTLPIYDDEPSSMIAYSLASPQHLAILHGLPPDVIRNMNVSSPAKLMESLSQQASSHGGASAWDATPSPRPRKLSALEEEDEEVGTPREEAEEEDEDEDEDEEEEEVEVEVEAADEEESETPALPDMHKTPVRRMRLHRHQKSLLGMELDLNHLLDMRNDRQKLHATLLSSNETHFRHKFESYPSQFSSRTSIAMTYQVTVYFPQQFFALRQLVCGGDDMVIQSLARCNKWAASGGKSGSTFAKTHDERLVLKFIKMSEWQHFMEKGRAYFAHMAAHLFRGAPSVLVKLLGLYQISLRGSDGRRMERRYVIVMPNLFYNRNISQIFDLKGSVRNRYTKDAAAGNKVMLDMNLMEYNHGFPFPLFEVPRREMQMAIYNDARHLAAVGVCDYSLIVGLDEERHELVVGIIDYLRRYDYLERFEDTIKSSFSKDAPTVQAPPIYESRFVNAMSRYFIGANSQQRAVSEDKLPDAQTAPAERENMGIINTYMREE